MEEAVAIDQVIQKNFSQLQKPGVLFVRPGYKAQRVESGTNLRLL
jgi:hypothetical protein